MLEILEGSARGHGEEQKGLIETLPGIVCPFLSLNPAKNQDACTGPQGDHDCNS